MTITTQAPITTFGFGVWMFLEALEGSTITVVTTGLTSTYTRTAEGWAQHLKVTQAGLETEMAGGIVPAANVRRLAEGLSRSELQGRVTITASIVKGDARESRAKGECPRCFGTGIWNRGARNAGVCFDCGGDGHYHRGN